MIYDKQSFGNAGIESACFGVDHSEAKLAKE